MGKYGTRCLNLPGQIQKVSQVYMNNTTVERHYIKQRCVRAISCHTMCPSPSELKSLAHFYFFVSVFECHETFLTTVKDMMMTSISQKNYNENYYH